jgi:hypothetical protein
MTTIAMTAEERRGVLEDPELTDAEREQIFAAAAAGAAPPAAGETLDEAAALRASLAIDADRKAQAEADQVDWDAGQNAAAPVYEGGPNRRPIYPREQP